MRATYVALGHSMSIDRYPDLDHAGRQHLRPPPSRWLHLRLPVTGLGAASLLAGNYDHASVAGVRREGIS